jgi:thiol:disulfide interchange protein DsbA
MTIIKTLLTVAAVTFLVACGDSPDTTAVETSPPEQAVAPAPAEPTEVTQELAESVPEETADEEPAEEKLDDNKIVLAQVDPAPKAAAAPQKYSEGQHYTVLATAQGTSSSPDVVEVAEVFWYGCPHCYSFDPYVAKWETELPDGVEIVRLPVMWNPTNEIHARMFYTADALGKLDEMHEEIFKEMHLNKKTLTSEADIEALFAKHDVSSDDFKKTFRSFPVETKLKKAKNLTQRYRVQSVPLLIVNGKYVTTGPGIKDFDDMISVANELIAREQAEL